MEHVSRLGDMEICIARGTAIFGPYDNFDLKTCHVVPALIKRLLSGENPFVVWGSPDVVRDFLYVKDVIQGGLLILEKGESMRPYNLTNSELGSHKYIPLPLPLSGLFNGCCMYTKFIIS